MVLRALFWVALVSLFMPREPDLGPGRPGSHNLAGDAASWVASAASQPQNVCREREAACAAGLGVLDTLQSVAMRSLAQVKADIEAAERKRAARNG